jgi:uncharacterized protein (DUF433 family)
MAGEHLSYLELIETAVVAVFRSFGVSLSAIGRTREYMTQMFGSEFPFVEHKFKTDGVRMLLSWREYEDLPDLNEVIIADASGQLGWEQMMANRLAEFDYINDLALIWHVAGRSSKVAIDPRIAFGAPSIHGIQTRTVKGRYDAGESVEEIQDDLNLESEDVRQCLAFEGIKI